jgi:hypothetical protein
VCSTDASCALQLLAGTARISRFNILLRFLVKCRAITLPVKNVFYSVYFAPHIAFQDDSVLKTVAATLAHVKGAGCSEQEWLTLRDKFFPQ